MPLRDGFFSTATQTSCCNRIQRSNRVRLLVVSTHDFPDTFLLKYARALLLTEFVFAYAPEGRLCLRLQYTRLIPDSRTLLFILQNIVGYIFFFNAVECLLQ